MPLFRRFLRDNRRGLLGFCVGMILLCASYLPLYPSFGTAELESIYAQFPEPLRRAFGIAGLQDGAGYTQSTIFGVVGTLIAVIATVGWGAAAVAGDEEGGGLELTLARGVTRAQLVLERGLALLVQSVALAGTVALVVLAMNAPTGLGLAVRGVLGAGAAMALLAALYGLLALAVGAVTGRRGAAIATGTVAALAGYVSSVVGSQRAGLEWLSHASPFSWAYATEPLRHGLDLAGAGLLAATAGCLWLLAVWGLARRDVGA